MRKHYDISKVKVEGDFLILIIDGEKRIFQLQEISSLLHNASDQERNTFKISPSGYGIHWPLIDEDLSIDGLLGISHAPELYRKSA